MASFAPYATLTIDLIRDLLSEAADGGSVRSDVAPEELANYCLYALAAATSLPSKVAVRRLVQVTLAGLQPQATAEHGVGDQQTRHDGRRIFPRSVR
jgi:hypothetical protein